MAKAQLWSCWLRNKEWSLDSISEEEEEEEDGIGEMGCCSMLFCFANEEDATFQ